jgi:hypothetical protein
VYLADIEYVSVVGVAGHLHKLNCFQVSAGGRVVADGGGWLQMRGESVHKAWMEQAPSLDPLPATRHSRCGMSDWPDAQPWSLYLFLYLFICYYI